MKDPVLKVENLSVVRDGQEILKDVNLELYPGQVHTLLGLNGSGKSTLGYTLMGCGGYAPSAGHLWMDGKDITHATITERARMGITLAWQEPVRFEGIPVGKYVGLGVPQPNREAVIAALEAVALPAKVYGYRSVDSTLSGGERKRIELAAVYAMHPRVAILDEPDSGIDVLSLGEIEHLIRNLAAGGTAVLLVTHREELAATADVTSLMCFGTVIFTGDPEEGRTYYTQRCRPHLESLGSQPWQNDLETLVKTATFGKPIEPVSQSKETGGQG